MAQYFMRIYFPLAVMLWLGALSVRAEYFYVTTNSVPVPPYTNWANAATNIQDAVNVATNAGDIVLVSNGVYTTTTPVFMVGTSNIVALTNAITLKSVSGPATTVINGYQDARCVFISRKATLDGFTVRNGSVNYSSSEGGGIYIHWRGTNDADESHHGGTVTNCIVYDNYASVNGGGISIFNATGIVANCTIYSNTAKYDGGGMKANTANSGSMINNCVFWGNKTMDFTTGIQGGGGLFIYRGTITVKNCLFYRNDSYRSGGGVLLSTYNPGIILESCTITSNTASDIAGGLCITTTAAAVDAVVRNLIVWDNYSPTSADAFTATLLTNSCIGDTNGVPNWNTSGNITNNPQFVDAANDNYRLGPNSPCVKAGVNEAWMTGAVDLDGHPRIFRGTVDMGAYEYSFRGTIISFH